jgi:hypothetical protein
MPTGERHDPDAATPRHQPQSRSDVVSAVARGAIAGAIATVAMDLVWYRRYRASGGDLGPAAWEFTSTAPTFDDAPAPARVGRRIARTVGVELPDSAITPTNNVVHWMTGVGWGAAAGVVAAKAPVPSIIVGMATGATAWATSYPLLAKLGIYRPITEYDIATLWKDLSAHLVFGASLGATLTLLPHPTRA